MKTFLIVAASFCFGMAWQQHLDAAFVASTFRASSYNLEENVMQGAALLDMCEAQVKGKK